MSQDLKRKPQVRVQVMHRVAAHVFTRSLYARTANKIQSSFAISSLHCRRAMSSEAAEDPAAEAAAAVPKRERYRSNSFGPEDINVDWDEAARVWDRVAVKKELPAFVIGDGKYGITDLDGLQQIGENGEFQSNSSMYNRHKTFAVRIGYCGSAYEFGYQRQKYKDEDEPLTVELDVYNAMCATSLGNTSARLTTAGRTDKYVSASAQIINFVHSAQVSPQDLLQELQRTEPVQAGRLAFHDCARVPRQFNARACATWRRYLYLVPLTAKPPPATPPPAEAYADADAPTHAPFLVPEVASPESIDIAFVDEVFRSLEGLTLPYNAFAVGEDRKTGEGMLDLCTMHRAKAYEVRPDGPTGAPFLCVELVGSRFLRRMVRLLVATAVREALKTPAHERDVECIVKICEANDRTLRALPFPGSGLCFSGAGFDLRKLSFWKQQKKVDAVALVARFAQEDAEAEAEAAGLPYLPSPAVSADAVADENRV